MDTVEQSGNQMERFKCAAETCGRGLSVICLTALAGILAPLLFVVVMAIIESIQPGYSPIRETISRLVLGAHGWFQTISFFLFGFLFAIFSLRLYLATLRSKIAKTGAGLLLLSSLSFFILGAFPVDPDGAIKATITGMIHNGMAATAAVTFVLGILAFAIYFGLDVRWHKYRWFTLFIALACLGFSLIWKFSPDTLTWKGLAQRFVLLSGFLWIEVVAIRLLRVCAGKGQP